MINFISIIPLAVSVLAIVPAAGVLSQAFRGLRAKVRIKALIEEVASFDEELRQLIKYAVANDMDVHKYEMARRRLIEISRRLSKMDQELIFLGLRQSSRSAEESYINELLHT